ncbi:C40 family peptidase [Anaerosacchariphilus sp. NSJ-68]|uniref:C40 family peptidase n=2 Tax=Lachnospiraceae TaxID=186803 RepID=A0A923RMY4_9FIRM|nr:MULTISPECIES: C40 family peptidase [Lachnospiraceae]MBC5659936.1 C40 family peptidase [Anaerosacchariphilus hominis]MBC5697603.1 C40 family peptidase [Roseburia difficilis]
MYRRYRTAGLVLGAIFLASVGMNGMDAQASGLGDSLNTGVASNFSQAADTEELTQATAEVVWTGTPLEGYVNIAIANVEDNLNIRASADGSSQLVGKLRKNGACEILGSEGEWSHIRSGEVEGYVKTEYLYTGQEAVDLAFQLGQTVARVNTDSLYVRMEPSTDADYWTKVPSGEELQVIEEMEDWVKVDIDGEDGYVAAEYVDVTSELDTALTLSEALYGEGVTDVRIAICDFAQDYVGNRYVWGGTSLTKGADCSGFVLAVYRNFGISLPHSSRAQANCGTKISVGDVKPGDLIFYGNGKRINHVAMYIGGGRVVHASNPRTGITISNMYYRSPVSAARILKD